MWLPQELGMLIGSYLGVDDLRMCTTQLCSSGAGFVSNLLKKKSTTMRLLELIACCRSSAGDDDDVAQECLDRIESFLSRRGNVHTITLVANMVNGQARGRNARVYSNIHRRLQQGSSHQLIQNQGITVEWHLWAGSPSQVKLLLGTDGPKDGARVSDSSTNGSVRQYLHTLGIFTTRVSDVSVLASCQSLHTLILHPRRVSNMSALASCRSLHTLNLQYTQVNDVTALASCQSLHTLDLSDTQVSDVSALASCQSLHTLDLTNTQVSDVSALASCQSLHTLDLSSTQVNDVSALASCQSLRQLLGDEYKYMTGAASVLRAIAGRAPSQPPLSSNFMV
jgi:hypothetical protein